MTERASVWRCGAFTLTLDRTLVMGILNVTPDSFSDGGRFADPSAAAPAALQLLQEGADIVDVGGESTRPGAAPVDPAEEAGRILPSVRVLAEARGVVSVDSRHAEAAGAALAAGAAILNDVSGFRDPAMVALASGSTAGCIVMHMLGEPGTMQQAPRYDDVVAEVADYLARQAGMLEEAGVARERIAVDPGIGFGKTTEHNLALLRGIPAVVALGYPVVVGVSRKRFIGELTGVEQPAARLEGSLAAAAYAASAGAHVIRAHDVEAHVKALRMTDAIAGKRAR